MKICGWLFVFLFVSGLGFCQSSKTEKQEDEIIVIAQKENRKYGITATFYGIRFKPDEDKEEEYKIIKHIIFRQSGADVKYHPPGSIPAGDFYFAEIWSPDEEYLVLPLGKFEGFGVFEAKDALQNIQEDNYLDRIKTGSSGGGFYWHDFGKWEDSSTFSFRAGLDGDMFAFKYNLKNSELYCYRTNCEENSIGINNKGKIKAAKKGDIAPTKLH